MSDQSNPEIKFPEDFRSQVQRLVAEGKLTAEEAAGLLEGTAEAVESPSVAQYVKAVQDGESVANNLLLRVTGYNLSVVQDPSVAAPQLSANREGELSLSATEDGWIVERVRRQDQHYSGLRAILTLPFEPQHVKAEIHGGNLNIPDVSGEFRADVNGGNIRMGNAASLWADVNGGNLNAERVAGPTHLSVNGGNLTLGGAESLNASVNGGNLKWTGVLHGGNHRVEVNAGNATLNLLAGSGVRVEADVTVGSFKADFPTEKQGSFVTTRHRGQLGDGSALLSCKVAAGQVKLVTT